MSNQNILIVKMRLVYVMDPMCSWCYAFEPELEEFLAKHTSAVVEFVMGGLAPDSDEPMDENLKQTISSYWYEIQNKTQVTFNHDYWKLNTPYRSTYPACRAVIAAESLKTDSAHKMIKEIQSAYYMEAKNPSLKETLVSCASSIGLDEKKFLKVFESEETEKRLQEHFNKRRALEVRAFPTLFYIDDKNNAYPLTRGYTTVTKLEQQLKSYTH